MTAGEGGIVLTNRLDCYEALQSIINCGRPSITDKYERKVLGANYRMTELQASLLIGQLDMWPELCEKRTRHAALLGQALGSLPHVRALPPQPGLERETIYHFVFQYRPSGAAPSRVDPRMSFVPKETRDSDKEFWMPK